MQLTDRQIAIMEADGHLLVTGGPGSGKTTVSILKAARLVSQVLKPHQSFLFLSFARATVSRVVEAIEQERDIPREVKRRIDVDTYHSFFWRVLKTHGYLVGLPRKLTILTPPGEAIALSGVRSGYAATSKLCEAQKTEKKSREHAERVRLATSEGSVCFDLFAPYVGDLLEGSDRIRRLIATMYPVIIFDEFQDTNDQQWRVVKALGQCCILLALADPEQRIYDFIGAHPDRLNHFRAALTPKEFDLSTDNHRSAGTDIAVFANDVLKGTFTAETYTGIQILAYRPNEAQAFAGLITTTYKARRRLVDSGRKDWSLAILVPTKKLTRTVSDYLREPPGDMAPIAHIAAIELEAAILAAEIIAFLMQPERSDRHFERVVGLVCNYYHGKGGDTPTKGALNEAADIKKAHQKWAVDQAAGKPMRAKSIVAAMYSVYLDACAYPLAGDPDRDWRGIRGILENGNCSRLKELALEARNIRLLERGSQLRQCLSQDWLDNGAYANALNITRQAFVQEHFATTAKPETGVVVMNMHKAKGKQFDEVIIFEGWPNRRNGKIEYNGDRIVRGNDPANVDSQSRQNLRVSITRGKQQTTILTPKGDRCILLPR
jgi:DNA helicase II / ATP-dependent DNA helicase PcrA